MKLPRLISALLLTATSLASAHQVWIEEIGDSGKLGVRFGEFGDSLEKSPGYLDNLVPVLAWLPAKEGDPKPLVTAKKEDHFAIEGSAKASETLVETAFPVMGKPGAPGKWPLFYLRWQPAGTATAASSTTPAMTLDLVPEGAGKVRVYFRGKPLPDTKVTAHQPGGATVELTSDKEGRFTFTSDKAGVNILTVNFKEALPGFSEGKAYDTTSHNASLAWKV